MRHLPLLFWASLACTILGNHAVFASGSDDPQQEVLILEPEDPEDPNIRYGQSVDAAGRLLVVGVRRYPEVYVYDTTQPGWWQSPEIVTSPADDDRENNFGDLVVTDGHHVIVGDRTHDGGCEIATNCQTGRVYIYEPSSSSPGWDLIQALNMPEPEQRAYFGMGIAIDGEHLLVGAPGETYDEHGFAGVVYAYRRSGDDKEWECSQEIHADTPSQGAYYGRSIEVEGDTLFIGSHAELEIHRWDEDDGSWNLEQVIEGVVGYSFEYLDDDEIAIRSRPLKDEPYTILIYAHDGKEWKPEHEISPDDDDVNVRHFGSGMAKADQALIVVDHSGSHDAVSRVGAAYLFRYDSEEETWVNEEKLLASDRETGDSLGLFDSVTVVGDLVVLGTQRARDDEGAAYVFALDGEFLRGDLDEDGDINSLTDGLALLKFVFLEEGSLDCHDAADFNDDGKFHALVDLSYLIAWEYVDGPDLSSPSGECAPDLTTDELSCETSSDSCD